MSKLKIKNQTKFAEAHDMSKQSVCLKIKAGYKRGILDGEEILYNPKMIVKVKPNDEGWFDEK